MKALRRISFLCFVLLPGLLVATGPAQASSLIFSVGIASATTGTFYVNSVGYHGPIHTSRDGSTTAGCYNNPNWWVYESDHFLVYSDISSDDVRVQFAQMAEAEFDAVKTVIGVTDAELGISTTASSSKLHICSDGVGSNGTGNSTGISMPALDGQNLDPLDRLHNYYGYRHTVRHELTHVIQSTLAHDSLNGSGLELWFLEGQAVLIGRHRTLMDTLSLADYYATGRPNPISVKSGQAMVAAGLSNEDIYPAFGLAVKYLFDTTARGGAGNSLLATRSLLRQIGNGASFSAAFASTFSRAGAPLTLDAYTSNFQSWINSYLGNLETPGMVTGATGISMVGVFPYNTGCDLISGFGSTVTSSGAFALNVSELANGTYENAICFIGDDGSTIYGPATITVSDGRLSPTGYDVSQWPRRCATLYPDAEGFTAAGASGVVTVASMSCSWTATSNDSWITITSGSSGTGSGTVSYFVSAKTTGGARTGTMTIGGQTFTVTQSGLPSLRRRPVRRQ